jgi:hypothetical protein
MADVGDAGATSTAGKRGSLQLIKRSKEQGIAIALLFSCSELGQVESRLITGDKK